MSMVINNNNNNNNSDRTTTSESSTVPSSSSSAAFRQAFLAAGFLDQCFLCRTKLSPGKDIYMYRGDRAFCSEECRSKQIQLDEEEAFSGENHHSSYFLGGRTASRPSSPRNRRGSRK